MHYEAIKEAIGIGCHVFSEKPLTDNGASAVALYELAKQQKVKTAFSASYRYMPDVLHAKQLVANGKVSVVF